MQIDQQLPWVPEVSHGLLRDLPAEALTETGNRARQTSGTQGSQQHARVKTAPDAISERNSSRKVTQTALKLFLRVFLKTPKQ